MFAGHWQLLLGLVVASPESDYARTLYERQRYTDAAEAFERLWAEEESSLHLFNAALARQAAGDLTHANLYLRMISRRSDLGDDERTEAAERVGWLRQALTAIEVEIRPARALGPDAELHLARGGEVLTVGLSDLDEAPGRSSEPDRGRSWTLYLEPGEWTLDLVPRSPRLAYNAIGAVEPQQVVVPKATASDLTLTLSTRFTITPELAPLEIDIGADAALRGVELKLIDPWGIHSRDLSTHEAESSLTLPTGRWDYEVTLDKHPWLVRPRGPTLAGELDLVASTSTTRRDLAQQLDHALATERGRRTFALASGGVALGFAALGGGLLAAGRKYELTRVGRDWDQVLDVGSAGAFFLSSGAGLAGTSLGTILGAGRRVWLTELALGGATSITAAAWYGLSRSSLPSGHYTQKIDDRRPGLYASMALLGIGTALSLGAGASLLLDHLKGKSTRGHNTRIGLQSHVSGGGIHVSF